MVILTHLLKGSLSNSSTSLTLLIDDNRFSGLAKVFWLNVLKNYPNEKLIITSDPDLQSLLPQEVVQIYPPHKLELSVFETPQVLFIDSLEFLIWVFGVKTIYERIKTRCLKSQGTIIAASKSYINEKSLNTILSLSEIILNIFSFSGSAGTAKCVHLRGYLKNSEEVSGFVIQDDAIKEIKPESKTSQKLPSSTFRLEMTEEEKKMKDLTPLPYEQFHSAVHYEPDEEGDEDDYY